MNWNDYEALWKRQELPVGAAADLPNLRATFESKRRKLAVVLRTRDVAEGSAGVFVAVAYAFIWWKLGKAGWPMALSILLILAVTAVFVRERIRTYRNRLGVDAPLLAKVDADIAELRHQRHLLRNIGIWYFAPLLLAIVIGGATLARRPDRTAPPGLLVDLLTNPRTAGWILVMTGTVVSAVWVAWRANRDAVWKQIDPRLAELEKLRRDLLDGA